MIGISEYKNTLIWVTVMLLLALQKHAGFIIFLFLPFFVVYVVHGLFLMIKQPELRKIKTIRTTIWVLTLLIISSVHRYWRVESRRDANAVASAIEAFKVKTGAYPHSLIEIGFNENALRQKWMLGYLCEDGRPFVAYADPFMIFASYIYDFKVHQWTYNEG